MTDEFPLEKIAKQFQIQGSFVEGAPFGSGHINDTFAITVSKDAHSRRYILQRINHHVFKDPKGLMSNISSVTRHITAKLTAQGADDIERRSLTLIPTQEGLDYHVDSEGYYWRCYIFIEKALTYDTPTGPEQVQEAARAFGQFQNELMDLPSDSLIETIPDFHNTRKRYDTLMAAIENDPHNRAIDVNDEIKFITEHESIVDILIDLNSKGEIPTRTTHNDTKLNNVMIDDQTGEGICVIDLDTVMPGLSLYDFGDCVRSGASTSDEDERDLSKVGVDLDLYKAITTGYLSSTGDLLTAKEVELLPISAQLITLETGIRFLTDYLDGDIYFKTHRDKHNIDRCRVQIERVSAMIKLQDEMSRITTDCSA
jgi:hypothetical protein